MKKYIGSLEISISKIILIIYNKPFFVETWYIVLLSYLPTKDFGKSCGKFHQNDKLRN